LCPGQKTPAATHLQAAIANHKFSLVATGGFGGLSPPNKAPSQARSQGGAIAPHNSESSTNNFQVNQAFDV